MTEDIGEDSDDSDDSDDDLNDDDDDEFRNFEESGEKSNNLIELQDDAVDSKRVLESTKH